MMKGYIFTLLRLILILCIPIELFIGVGLKLAGQNFLGAFYVISSYVMLYLIWLGYEHEINNLEKTSFRK